MIVVYDCKMFIIEATGGLRKMGHNRALHNGRLWLYLKKNLASDKHSSLDRFYNVGPRFFCGGKNDGNLFRLDGVDSFELKTKIKMISVNVLFIGDII